MKDERFVIAAPADVGDRLFRILRAPVLRERRAVRAVYGRRRVAQGAREIGRRVDAELRAERDFVGVDVSDGTGAQLRGVLFHPFVAAEQVEFLAVPRADDDGAQRLPSGRRELAERAPELQQIDGSADRIDGPYVHASRWPPTTDHLAGLAPRIVATTSQDRAEEAFAAQRDVGSHVAAEMKRKREARMPGRRPDRAAHRREQFARHQAR